MTEDEYLMLSFYDESEPKQFAYKDLERLREEHPECEIGNDTFYYKHYYPNIIELLANKYRYLKRPIENTKYHHINFDEKLIISNNGLKAKRKFEQQKQEFEELLVIENAKKWYDTENARIQFSDYPRTKRLAIWAIIFAGLATIAALVQLFVSLVRR